MEVTNDQKLLANRIRTLCEEKGITNYTLAYKSSVPLGTIIHIIKGESKNPGIFTITKICDGLEISLEEFFDGME